MSQNLPAVSSPGSLSALSGSLSAVLTEEQLNELIKIHAILEATGLIAQGAQSQMADNQLQAFAATVSTVDAAARLVAGSPSVTQEQLGIFQEMQNTYLMTASMAMTGANSSILQQLNESLSAIRRNGHGKQ